MQREARLALRPRRRLRCQEFGMPFHKAKAGNLTGGVATSEWHPGQRKFRDVRKSRRTGFACCCPPAATTGRHAMFQSTHSTNTPFLAQQKPDSLIPRQLGGESKTLLTECGQWLFSKYSERLQPAARSDFPGSGT